jgi:hypothetical protein
VDPLQSWGLCRPRLRVGLSLGSRLLYRLSRKCLGNRRDESESTGVVVDLHTGGFERVAGPLSHGESLSEELDSPRPLVSQSFRRARIDVSLEAS